MPTAEEQPGFIVDCNWCLINLLHWNWFRSDTCIVQWRKSLPELLLIKTLSFLHTFDIKPESGNYWVSSRMWYQHITICKVIYLAGQLVKVLHSYSPLKEEEMRRTEHVKTKHWHTFNFSVLIFGPFSKVTES